MKKVLVNIYSWENPRVYLTESDLEAGDRVIVEGDFGNELGTVTAINVETGFESGQMIVRKALLRDIKAFEGNLEKKSQILRVCRQEIKKSGLEIKIVDILTGLDGGQITLVFSAEERVDFRELVRNLTRILHRSVRMHQIGSRDEARRRGGCGVCGRELCCVKLLKNIPSITIETARLQQIAHRGSERISGQCGRLLCCLTYEASQYQEMMKDLPEIGKRVKTKEGVGEVIEVNPFSREIKIKLESGKIISHKKEEM